MPLNRRKVIFGLAASSLGCAGKAMAGVQVAGGRAFGSSWRIVAHGSADMAKLDATVSAIVAQVNRDMSPYLAASHLSRFNHSTTTEWQKMPPALCHVASRALRMARHTGGAFDPTVGPIVSRFGFGPIRGRPGRFSDIEVVGDAIRKADPHLTLDLCGIAKGYALDQITDALARIGVAQALVELGGEVTALGHHPKGRAWQVAIADPTARDFRAHRIVAPGHFALATSGHAANGVRGPVSASHIIDPEGHRPSPTSLASVSVLAPTGMEADALATALCAAGPVDGPELARRQRIAALFITDESETDREIITGSFSHHILI